MKRNTSGKENYKKIGNFLRILVILSAALMIIGAVMYLGKYGNKITSYHVFTEENSKIWTISSIVENLRSFNPQAIIQISVIILVMVPFVRVLLYLISFGKQNDWLYCGITAVVLAFLIFSLFGYGV